MKTADEHERFSHCFRRFDAHAKSEKLEIVTYGSKRQEMNDSDALLSQVFFAN
jgi:hypothetical protein